RKVEQNHAFACGAGAKCEAVALSAHVPNNPRQRAVIIFVSKAWNPYEHFFIKSRLLLVVA
ncbi:MAG TPA: hypothetical protein DEF63_00895, partial [Cyanobacteria bacterium UBA11440]|nr:hypothetical protein [Cyanobacteria bacterium UBA11440]